MKTLGANAAALGLGLSILTSVLLPGCGGGGSGDGGSDNDGPMFIESCSLGCSSGQGGATVSCTIVSSALNNEISVVFSEPVDPFSVDSSTFQLIDVGTGQVPAGSRLVDPGNPRKVLFRPSVTFDSQGNAVFGFTPNTTYRVTVPGTEHGDPAPFIRSTGGKDNGSRMQCDIQTTNVVDDLVPGSPTVFQFVDLAITSTPDVTDHVSHQPAAGAEDVWRDSEITFVFNDIMNPQTLANPTTHQSALITVQVDSDGDFATTTDQVTLFGNYFVVVDVSLLQTVMRFVPANGMPSAGEPSPSHPDPRLVIVTVPPGVQDLAGHSIANPGDTNFTPELVTYTSISLPDADGENFTSAAGEDLANTGATWGEQPSGVSWHVLTSGWGGGSGRLGVLRVVNPQTLELNTDGTVFKHLSAPDPVTTLPIIATSGLLDNARPTLPPAGYDPLDRDTWPTATVTDGVFEFSSLIVEGGSTLRISGTKHARLFSRGPVVIDGKIDVRGESCPSHSSDAEDGEPGGLGGPNGGDGGDGGDRVDNSLAADILGLPAGSNGISNPGAVLDGGPGGGVGRSGTLASGKGGNANPDPPPTGLALTDPTRGALLFSSATPPAVDLCKARQVGSPGGGGAYALDGGNARPLTPDPLALDPITGLPSLPNRPASARGGDAQLLNIEPPDPQSGHSKRKLDAAAGNLRGGSGGGGGGTHLYDTNQTTFTPTFGGCYQPPDQLFFGIEAYFDHSAGGGGGGGGAVQVVSGRVMRVAGVIDAIGGDGSDNVNSDTDVRGSRAEVGGGGSGGAVRLQGVAVNLLPANAPRIDVRGGIGGENTSHNELNDGMISLGRGGSGSPGLIRLEDLSSGSNPPATLMTRCSEAPKFLPFDPADLNPNTSSGPCLNLPESEDILSVGPWALPTARPETFTAAVSCWIRPGGDFFTINFAEDDLAATPPTYGWNMQVDYDSPSAPPVLVGYRGREPNTPFGSGDFESNLGSAVNYLNEADPPGNQFGTGSFNPAATGTYMCVRFQGAVAVTNISGNPCDVQLSGVGSDIAPGSLTPWVRHPADLNKFLPTPNMIRFCVVFDRSLAVPSSVPSFIRGVTNLVIRAKPD